MTPVGWHLLLNKMPAAGDPDIQSAEGRSELRAAYNFQLLFWHIFSKLSQKDSLVYMYYWKSVVDQI